MQKNFTLKTCRKKVTGKLLITDLLIFDKFSLLNFKRIAMHVVIENKPDELLILCIFALLV